MNFDRYQSKLSAILGLIVIFFAVIGSIYGLGKYIDSRIEKAINNPDCIRKIAANIRPYIIFDINETILVDSGGMQYLEKIEVAEVVRSGGRGSGIDNIKIIVEPKQHLAYPPLMENLSVENIQFLPAVRGKGHQWIYELHVLCRFGGDKKEIMRFRLEIIR